mgnify:FL=1
MKAWLDFLPLILFFVAYKVAGVFTAAAVLMVSVVVLYGIVWWRERKLQSSQWITLGATVLLGSLTLILHDEAFLQWKAPAVNVLLALLFAGSALIGKKPLIERLMGESIQLAPPQWRKLNTAWVLFFLFCAAANAWVVLYHTAWWVDFKLFGSLGMTFTFIIAQGIWLTRQGALKDTPTH